MKQDMNIPIITQARVLAYSEQVIEDIEQAQYLIGLEKGKKFERCRQVAVSLSELFFAFTLGMAVCAMLFIAAL